ncbi:hypothetical protein [Natronolimnobius baerhuensis]|uniref:Uncharacterized protein n=1 Tax=Natronolimnobius baerhuensis TaxID=253108 RepID=A0A202EDY4_9EURY|nr:hypothetical protein [Natronolimnobius baerhuensis]OVE86398.1 hypothetical protein B2G88_01955 [Natronolimnobius baerhuensis]
MSNESTEKAAVFSEGIGAPIAGLLALVFAVMAGMSVFPALSGTAGDIAMPLILGGASLLFFRVRQRYLGATESQ